MLFIRHSLGHNTHLSSQEATRNEKNIYFNFFFFLLPLLRVNPKHISLTIY